MTTEPETPQHVHHWLVGKPSFGYTRRGAQLVETTRQVCRDCGEKRLNQCVIPATDVQAMPLS